MSACGIPQEAISSVIGLSSKTLRLYYSHELETAEFEANATVANSLFTMATTGGNVTAAIFWLKTRARWRETKPEADEAEAVAQVNIVISGGLPEN